MKNVILSTIMCIAFYSILTQLGCEECEPETTRCSETSVQICNSSGFWETEMDCQEVDTDWRCCWDKENELHSCLPKEECQ